ncbi:hypothetical protein CANARDRAFT_5303 [[Candida] arabinofermentans NRRL YB-2248]|uniref:mRNA export factor GLE1 n=1 Tax=[Candida] arabinofermentans NRRL YB-2248 TaxID=983967 RepID=A0A1E4T8L6_9ASCO|nr:hypothetical protein CANARDRAFT_5303 [[Candida] arabinofermentans NRRL YB-2248]
MRFTPHRHEYFENASDYDSLSDSSDIEELFELSNEDGKLNLNSELDFQLEGMSVESPSSSEDELGDILERAGLTARFNMINIIDRLTPTPITSRAQTPVGTPISHQCQEIARIGGNKREETPAATDATDITVQFVSDAMKNKLKQSKEIVNNLIRLDRERKEAEEAERRRIEEEKRLAEEARLKAEEEARRKAEEEEALKREAERKLREAKEKELAEKKAKEEAAKLKAEADAKAAKEKAEADAKAAIEKANEESKKSKSTTNFLQIEKDFLKYKQDIIDIKTNVVEQLKLPENKALKTIVGQQRRKINPKFGQLTHHIEQYKRIVSEIHEYVTQAKANDLAYKFILNFIAKAVVAQAETEVTVNSASSIPLATLALNLLLLFPELEYYLIARFVKKCPLVIGYTCAVDTEEGRLRMGWKRKSDGKWEEDVQYNERLSGIATVYAVMTRLRIDHVFVLTNDVARPVKHPLPISNSWHLVVRALNTPLNLITNVHFCVLGAWWESCAFELLEAYGKQAAKIIRVTCEDWTLSVADRKYSGAARLRLLGEDYAKDGTMQRFKGMGRD